MEAWRLWIESEPVPTEEWTDRADVLLECLETSSQVIGPVGWGAAGSTLGAVFEMEAETAQVALDVGVRMFTHALELATKGLHPAHSVGIRRLKLSPEDFEPREAELLGASDVATVLGVSRQRVYQLLNSFTSFPRPTAELARGSVWSRREIETWQEQRPDRVEWIVNLLMRVQGRPPRVHDPDSDQKNQLVDLVLHLRGSSFAGWEDNREFRAIFVVDAVSRQKAAESAAHLVKWQAQRGAQIAIEDDLDVEIVDVQPVEKP